MPRDPAGEMCEWCELPAIEAIELRSKVKAGQISTGTYVYCCGRHQELAHDVVAAKAEDKRKF